MLPIGCILIQKDNENLNLFRNITFNKYMKCNKREKREKTQKSCHCYCNLLMETIKYMYERNKLLDNHLIYITQEEIMSLRRRYIVMPLTTILCIYCSKTNAALIFYDLRKCNCCDNHVKNKPTSKKIMSTFSILNQ